jgi:branched-chain amino acid transport system substrate-binding protein
MTYFPFDANDTSPVVQEFVKRFKEKTGKDVPSAPTATAYDSMMLLAEAIKAANSSDRDAIRQALGSLKGVKLAANTYTYSGNGDNVDQHAKLFAIGEDGLQHRVEQ